MDRLARPLVLLLALCAGVAGCTSDDIPTTSTPTTTVTVTDTFNGSLNQNGGASYPFTVTAAGNVTVSLVALNGDAAKVGISIGTWNGTACTIVIANDAAVAGTNVLGASTAAGSLCVRVYDVGAVSTPVTYQIQVTHL